MLLVSFLQSHVALRLRLIPLAAFSSADRTVRLSSRVTLRGAAGLGQGLGYLEVVRF